MKEYRPAKKRIAVTVGQSVRIIRELQELSQNQLARLTSDRTLQGELRTIRYSISALQQGLEIGTRLPKGNPRRNVHSHDHDHRRGRRNKGKSGCQRTRG